MFDIVEIRKAFFNLVGWKNNTYEKIQLSENLKKTESGLTYQQGHALINLDNVNSFLKFNKFGLKFQEYEEDKTYYDGDIVSFENKLYKSKSNNNTNIPTDLNMWYETNELSLQLEDKQNDVITRMINNILQDKRNNYEIKTTLENRYLYERSGNYKNFIVNRGDFVGFCINPMPTRGVRVNIEQIGIHLEKTQTITLYLYCDTHNEPLRTFEINGIEKQMTWNDTDVILKYIEDTTDAGVRYYLGYFQSELSENENRAINRGMEFLYNGCYTCSRFDDINYRAIRRHAAITPFRALDMDVTDRLFWRSNIIWEKDFSYGLNLKFKVYCDITDLLIENKSKFANVMLQQMTYDLLEEYVFNPNNRINSNELNINSNNLTFQMYGANNTSSGTTIAANLKRAYEAIELEMKGIDGICLPCKSGKINYTSF